MRKEEPYGPLMSELYSGRRGKQVTVASRRMLGNVCTFSRCLKTDTTTTHRSGKLYRVTRKDLWSQLADNKTHCHKIKRLDTFMINIFIDTYKL